MAKISFWFDFASTYSYLTAMRISPAAEKAGVDVEWMPFLLGPIFAANGWKTSPFNIYPAKGKYMWRDIERQAAHHGVVFVQPEQFPQFALLGARVGLAAAAEKWLPDYCRALFRFEYGKGGDITSPAAVEAALRDSGQEPFGWIELAQSEPVKNALKQRGERAVELGIFGAPTFVTEDGELFWGDDRLEQALAWSAARSA